MDEAVYAVCDDATLATRCGVSYLMFDREALDFETALRSAIKDIGKAGLDVTRVEPDDLVCMAEIARRSKRTRESVRQLINGERGPGGFPPPVAGVTTNSPLWGWANVARWLLQNHLCDNENTSNAAVIEQANRELQRHVERPSPHTRKRKSHRVCVGSR